MIKIDFKKFNRENVIFGFYYYEGIDSKTLKHKMILRFYWYMVKQGIVRLAQ